MALTRRQRRIVNLIVGIGHHRHESRKEIVSALETGAVEANFSNPRGGSGSSSGWRQETSSSYPNVNRRNVRASINRYYDETSSVGHNGRGMTAGQLAQAVQRSAYPGKYDQQRGLALRLYRRAGGGGASAGSGGTPGTPGVAGMAARGIPPAAAPIVAELLKEQMAPAGPPPSSGLTPPAFAARPRFAGPQGGQTLPGGGAPEPPPDVGATIQKLAALAGQAPGVQHSPVAGAPGTPGANGSAQGGKVIAGGHYPLGKRGKVIGVPYQGTHTLGDWESDNAVDVAIRDGTPVRAVQSGVIGPQIGSLGKGGQFAGLRVHLNSRDNEYYYAHLSRLTVKAGQRVRKGQIIGYSGSANGVQHLHFGQKRGDPRRTVR